MCVCGMLREKKDVDDEEKNYGLCCFAFPILLC